MKNGNSKELKAEEVFKLVKEVWRHHKEKKGDFKLNKDGIYWMFMVLDKVITAGNSKWLEAETVFELIKDVLDVWEKEEDDGSRCSVWTSRCILKAVSHAIEEGNSKELKTKEVFD